MKAVGVTTYDAEPAGATGQQVPQAAFVVARYAGWLLCRESFFGG